MERLTEERIAELLELHTDDAACEQLVSERPLHDIYVQACQLAHELRAERAELDKPLMRELKALRVERAELLAIIAELETLCDSAANHWIGANGRDYILLNEIEAVLKGAP